MNRYRIVMEFSAIDLRTAQLFAASIKSLASQVHSSDLMADYCRRAETDLVWQGNTQNFRLEEQPPSDWQPREYIPLTRIPMSDSMRRNWNRLLELPDFDAEVD